MHHGDPIEELIEEELVDQGYIVGVKGRSAGNSNDPSGSHRTRQGVEVEVQHFRSEDMMYTFQSPLPIEASSDLSKAIRVATQWLLAYEAAFRRLGDMEVMAEGTV